MAATYDPTLVDQNGRDRVRFELGDTDPEAAELQDEEIDALLNQSDLEWLPAAARGARVIHRRYARQATFSVGPVKFDNNARAKTWGELADQLEAQAGVGFEGAAMHAVPSAGGLAGPEGNYFQTGMHDA